MKIKNNYIYRMRYLLVFALFSLIGVIFFFSPNKSFSAFFKKSGVEDPSIINIKGDYSGVTINEESIASGIVSFSININENEEELNNGNTFTIINTLDNLTIERDSIKFLSNGGAGDFYEDPEIRNFYFLNDDEISFQVPDNRNIIIKYDALIDESGIFTNTVDFGNYKATLSKNLNISDTDILSVELASFDETNNMAGFQLRVNQANQELNAGNPLVVISDITNLQLDYNSFVVRNDITGEVLNSVSIDVLSNNKIKFVVPDSQPVSIYYSAKAIGDGTINYKNVVSWDDNSATVEGIANNNTYSFYPVSINVLSYEGDPSKVLENTVYQLLDSNKNPIIDYSGNPIEYKTGTDGRVTIVQDYNFVRVDTQYYLRRVSSSASDEVVDYPFTISSNASFDYENHIYLSGDTILDRIVGDGLGTLQITKTISGPVSEPDASGALLFSIKKTDSDILYYVDAEGCLHEEEVLLTLADFDNRLTFDEDNNVLRASKTLRVPRGHYLIEEVNKEIQGYIFLDDESVTSCDVDVEPGYNGEGLPNVSANVELINTYSSSLVDLTVSNQVMGKLADIDKEFNYAVSNLEPDREYEVVFGKITIGPDGKEQYYDIEPHATLSTNEYGELSFSLKHYEYARIEDVNAAPYVVEQTTNDGYTTSHIVGIVQTDGDGTISYGNYEGDSIEGRSVTVALDEHPCLDSRFINEINSGGDNVFTGVMTNVKSYIILLISVIIMGIGFVFLRKKNKKKRKDIIYEEEII